MLTSQFDYQFAQFKSIEDVILDEVEQADFVIVDGFVPGGVYFSQNVIWRGDLETTKDIKQFIRSKSERKDIDSNENYFLSRGYKIITKPLTEGLFEEFLALYGETVLKKKRAMHFDFKEKILRLITTQAPIYIICLLDEAGVLQSGLIFDEQKSEGKKEARVFYGAKKRFGHIRGGSGGVLEYELLKYCKDNGIRKISHGRAKNPAGLVSSSGIFEFKARYGYTAYPDGVWKTMFLKNPQIGLSDWVFLTIFDNQLGYLIVSDEKNPEIRKKYLTKEIKNIRVMTFEEVRDQYSEFLKLVK